MYTKNKNIGAKTLVPGTLTFEFKRDESADAALKQIEDMHYADPYAADSRKLYKIGVNFSSETRQMTEWKVEG